jgi:anti-anti-sigma factor
VRHGPTGKNVVHVSGELAGIASTGIRRIVAAELSRSPRQLVLDLSEVTTIDQSGMHCLVSAATQAGESDISFCLVGAHDGPVAAALAEARVTELFEIFAAVGDT